MHNRAFVTAPIFFKAKLFDNFRLLPKSYPQLSKKGLTYISKVLYLRLGVKF